MMPVLSEGSVGAEARAAYTSAFRSFSEKVRTLQRLMAEPFVARAEVEAAVLDVEKARIAYSIARDAAAQLLLDSPAKSVLPSGFNPRAAHTAEVAELLWEGAGRPEGTAEDDWYRAEEIIRLARAVTQPGRDVQA